MAIANKIKNMLNRGGNSVLHAFGRNDLGTVIQTIAAAVDTLTTTVGSHTTTIGTHTTDIAALETGAAKTAHIKHTVVADDIAAGVVSLVLDGAFDSYDTPLLTTAAGVFRVVTGVAIAEAEGVYTLSVTCAEAAATDVLHITVYDTTVAAG